MRDLRGLLKAYVDLDGQEPLIYQQIGKLYHKRARQ
jgi:hypothetical protein